MKYSDELFNLGLKICSQDSAKEVIDENTLQKQRRLLRILFKKFRELFNGQEKTRSGVLRIKLTSPYWSNADEGYRELDELVGKGHFDQFARDYCMYLGGKCKDASETHPDYYEVVWDYQTYFEQLASQKITISSNVRQKNNWFQKTLQSFHELPVEYQMKILKSFEKSVDDTTSQYQQDIAEATCAKCGHDFSKWKKITWNSRAVIWDAGPQGYADVENTKWERTCQRCGFVEEVLDEPKEAYEERKEREKKDRIKALKKELSMLEGKNQKNKA